MKAAHRCECPAAILPPKRFADRNLVIRKVRERHAASPGFAERVAAALLGLDDGLGEGGRDRKPPALSRQ